MKAKNLKSFISAALAVSALTSASVSFADGPYAGSLGPGTVNYAPTDVYRLVCPAGTVTVRARAVNPNGNPVDEIATTITAASSGRARTVIAIEGGVAPTAVLAGGIGVYWVSLHKDSDLFAARYSLTLDCYTASAAIAGTQTLFVQNQ